jgi:hypothetical protein
LNVKALSRRNRSPSVPFFWVPYLESNTTEEKSTC